SLTRSAWYSAWTFAMAGWMGGRGGIMGARSIMPPASLSADSGDADLELLRLPPHDLRLDLELPRLRRALDGSGGVVGGHVRAPAEHHPDLVRRDLLGVDLQPLGDHRRHLRHLEQEPR